MDLAGFDVEADMIDGDRSAKCLRELSERHNRDALWKSVRRPHRLTLRDSPILARVLSCVVPHLLVAGLKIEADVVVLPFCGDIGGIGELDGKILVHADFCLVQGPIALVDPGPSDPLKSPAYGRGLLASFANRVVGDALAVEANALDFGPIALAGGFQQR